MFWLGLGSGIVSTSLSFLLFIILFRALNKQKTGPIIEGSTLRGTFGRAPLKRAPKALTDLMAYNKEIEEEGQNRG